MHYFCDGMDYVELIWGWYRCEMTIHRLGIRETFDRTREYVVVNPAYDHFVVMTGTTICATCDISFGRHYFEPDDYLADFVGKVDNYNCVYIHRIVLRKCEQWKGSYTCREGRFISDSVIMIGICNET